MDQPLIQAVNRDRHDKVVLKLSFSTATHSPMTSLTKQLTWFAQSIMAGADFVNYILTVLISITMSWYFNTGIACITSRK